MEELVEKLQQLKGVRYRVIPDMWSDDTRISIEYIHALEELVVTLTDTVIKLDERITSLSKRTSDIDSRTIGSIRMR